MFGNPPMAASRKILSSSMLQLVFFWYYQRISTLKSSISPLFPIHRAPFVGASFACDE